MAESQAQNDELQSPLLQPSPSSTTDPPNNIINNNNNHDDDEPEKLTAPPNFNGPIKRHSCTDLYCLALIYAMWLAMTSLGLYAVSNGDYRIVLYPMDYDGNVCGTDYGSINMTDYPYLYYVNDNMAGVCVSDCPRLNGTMLADEYTLVTYGGIWQVEGKATLESDFIAVANYSTSEFVRYCSDDVCYPRGRPTLSYRSEGINKGEGFAFYAMTTSEQVYRCIAKAESLDYIDNVTNSKASNLIDNVRHFDAGIHFWSNLYADMWTAWGYILVFGLFLPMLLSYLFLTVLRFDRGVKSVVWVGLPAVFLMLFCAGCYAIKISNEWDDKNERIYSDTYVNMARYGGVAILVIDVLVLIILCTCLTKRRIDVAMSCIKATSRALNEMKSMNSVPILESIAMCLFTTVFITYSVYVMSCGTQETITETVNGYTISHRAYVYDSFLIGSAWFFLFCFFVTCQFITTVGSISISLTVSHWYFTRDEVRNKSSKKCATAFVSLGKTMRYHQGTAAYGSFVIGLVRFVRPIIAVFKDMATRANNKYGDALACCCCCCFSFYEDHLKFISKDAYVFTALFGHGFSEASTKSYFLLKRNKHRVGKVEYLTGTLTIATRFVVMGVCLGCGYFMMDTFIRERLNFMYGPLVVIGAISFFVSDIFMDLLDVGFLTIIQCFLADEEMFDGAKCYAGKKLEKVISKLEHTQDELNEEVSTDGTVPEIE